jgi:(1->4)-alpha-D-glucan 1-alpha-D-glucosylmutase
VTAVGPAAEHVLAFARGGLGTGGPAVTVATRLPVGLRARGGWSDTVLPLPASAPGWADVLTGAVFRGDNLLLGDVTGALPVALLVPEGE